MERRRTQTTLLVLLAMGGASIALAQTLAPVAVGGPPIPVHVAMMPTTPLTIAAAGEYQIDAMGAPMDVQLMLLQNGGILTQDSDSGEGVDARIVQFLAPGAYDVRVSEWRGRAASARLQVTLLPPMTPVASIAPGAPPTIVACPAGDSARGASAEVALTISAAGNYRIDAVSADGSVDPEMQLIQGGALLQSDSDSGEGTSAQIVRSLTPGAYTIRVRDWINRAANITVSVAAQ